MPRPQKCRCICSMPKVTEFGPLGNTALSNIPVTLRIDEYEVIRLLDYEQFSQEKCAERMQIARTTVTRMYDQARQKIATSLVQGRPLLIQGGEIVLCEKIRPECTEEKHCCHRLQRNQNQEENIMKIAVPYENELVFQHFGHSQAFKIYEIQSNRIASCQVLSTNGQGHGALAGFLKNQNVDTLICGGIGGGAKSALADAGITVYGGVSGKVDDAVNALLNHTLVYNPDIACSHHHEEGGSHNCNGEHHCHE